ncbi:MAG: gliding motility-associated C-terminal domain-containing protein [Cyclobacteriaceae bacterium]|jgi:gliding motility-associated-like protein|nr:gliding motility-associated C-terminal domain-containing protein [Cyclobacteriaceae bacterium]
MRLILFLTFILFVLGLSAQPKISVPNGSFRVDEVKGCAPLTVIFTSLQAGFCQEGAGNTPCVIDKEGDGITDFTSTNITNPLNFPITFTTPGTYTITVGYQGQGTNPPERVTITVLPNNQPNFDVYSCANDGVQVRVTDTQYDRYQITYSDGTITTVPKGSLGRHNHTFSSSGNYTIAVRGLVLNNDGTIAKNNCADATKNFTATLALTPPFITALESINDTDIKVDYNLATNTLARLEIATNNNTGFQPLQTIYNNSSVTPTGLNNNSSYYCFRTTLIDACTNALTNSASVCSIILNATANDGSNQLNWITNNANVNTYSVSKNTLGITGLPSGTNQFNDVDIICKETYTYTVEAQYTVASVKSLSKSVVSFNTQKPPAIINIAASFNDATVPTLTWPDQTQALTYSIFKTIDAGSPFLFTSVALENFTDNSFNLAESTCYSINYKNDCEATADIITSACPIIVSGNLNDQNTVNLNWNSYSGYQNGIATYRIEKYNANGNLLDQFDKGNTLSFTDFDDEVSQVIKYRIYGIPNEASLTEVSSNEITFIKAPNIYYPRAFTPNGDNLNDSFRVFGKYIREFRMKIFNRWGELLFTASNIDEAWDGTFKGKTQPEGTYVFSAEIVDEAGRTSTRSGSIVLLSRD